MSIAALDPQEGPVRTAARIAHLPGVALRPVVVAAGLRTLVERCVQVGGDEQVTAGETEEVLTYALAATNRAQIAAWLRGHAEVWWTCWADPDPAGRMDGLDDLADVVVRWVWARAEHLGMQEKLRASAATAGRMV